MSTACPVSANAIDLLAKACELLEMIERAGHSLATCDSELLAWYRGWIARRERASDRQIVELQQVARRLYNEAGFAQRRLPLRPGEPCKLLDIGYQMSALRSVLRDLSAEHQRMIAD